MIPEFFHSAQALVRALPHLARALLWRGAYLAAAGLIGAAGCGFVVFAGYATLRQSLGPELAALLTGIALLGLAAALVRFSGIGRSVPQIEPPADLPPVAPLTAPPQRTADPATMAVFTAAFVLGRGLANRRRN